MIDADIKALIRMRMEQAAETLIDSRMLMEVRSSAGRSVVNRAYYASFYALLALLQTINLSPRKHQGAIAYFEMEFVKTGKLPKEMSEIIRKLFRMRMEDDYQIMGPVDIEDAKLSIMISEKFIGEVNAFLIDQGWIEEK